MNLGLEGAAACLVTPRAYLKIFHQARAAAFTSSESASLRAKRLTTYGMRRCPPGSTRRARSQVAERAGHSIDVLLRVYAKCISGQQYEAKRRIEEATRPRDDE